MDINTNTNSINVKASEQSQKTSNNTSSNSDVKFSDELKNAKSENIKEDTKVSKEENITNKEKLSKEEKVAKEEKIEKDVDTKEEKDVVVTNEEHAAKEENITKTETIQEENLGRNKIIGELQNQQYKWDDFHKEKPKEVDDAISGLTDTLDELKNHLNKNHEDLNLIDNNMNIQEPQEKLNTQMGTNMEFNSNGQPFAEFVNQEKSKNELKVNAKDLAEEKEILSTMEENIAIANRNMALSKNKIVENEHGIQKVDRKTNIVVDTIVSYDNVVMDKADVEFFTNLVENGIVDIKDIKGTEKSVKVSQALADLLAKAMNDNKPVRIDFDNNISVIIKIDRAGKISADFLPSSQVAEAYLKENLPLLKQRFDENNIDYNELNQRQRKQDNQDNKKKGRKDE